MLGPLFKNYLRLKLVGVILSLAFGKKKAALKGSGKVTILTFILEELFNHVFKNKKTVKQSDVVHNKK